MAFFKRAMDYLGLGADDAYDDYDMPLEPERPQRARHTESPRSGRHAQIPPEYGDDLTVRPVSPRQTLPSRDADPVPSRRVQANDDSNIQPRPTNPRQGTTVRPLAPPPPTGEPSTVRPRRFDQAQEVADRFKEGQPVIMNLEGTEREVSRRLIDFASGLCYGLNGSMEKVATGVYLLKPPSLRIDD